MTGGAAFRHSSTRALDLGDKRRSSQLQLFPVAFTAGSFGLSSSSCFFGDLATSC
jgi:hypothetical protein